MFVRLLAVLGLFCALAAAPQPAAAQESLTVFAAASMKNALDDANAAFTKATGVKVVASYAASSALAKQIEDGAPADVFVSADFAWMDYASQHKLIKPDTRVQSARQQTGADRAEGFQTRQGRHRQGLRHRQARRRRTHRGRRRQGGAGRAAMPRRRWTSLGAWAAAEPKLAQAENVRATLAFVARGETPLGIVYATDAKIEPKVKIVGEFPDDSYPPVTYPVAATATSKNAAATRYLAFLRTQRGQGDLREVRLQLPDQAGVVDA